MGYYLLEHPPVQQQFYPNRVSPWTGGVLIHTAENVMDSVGPDTGAENVAAYIARRQDYGSYHILADSDSVIEMMPATYTAFHCAAQGYNSVTVGVSYACRTVDLNPDSDWFRNATNLIAGTLVRWFRDANIDPVQAARFVPATETRLRPGFSTHGEAQPVDRSDAWTRRPDRDRLEQVFRNAIIEAAGWQPQPEPGDDEVKTLVVRDPRDGGMWHVCGNTRFALRTQGEVDSALFMGAKFVTVPVTDPAAVKGLANYLTSLHELSRPRGK
jgi:hypothetical protein